MWGRGGTAPAGPVDEIMLALPPQTANSRLLGSIFGKNRSGYSTAGFPLPRGPLHAHCGKHSAASRPGRAPLKLGLVDGAGRSGQPSAPRARPRCARRPPARRRGRSRGGRRRSARPWRAVRRGAATGRANGPASMPFNSDSAVRRGGPPAATAPPCGGLHTAPATGGRKLWRHSRRQTAGNVTAVARRA